MSATHHDAILAKQLAMNLETWTALERLGLTEQSQVRLDFSYNARTKKAAEALRDLLIDQTDYDVRVESDGSFLNRKWRVEGTTQKTAISPTILDQWVIWMVAAGQETECDFDGWGTAVGRA